MRYKGDKECKAQSLASGRCLDISFQCLLSNPSSNYPTVFVMLPHFLLEGPFLLASSVAQRPLSSRMGSHFVQNKTTVWICREWSVWVPHMGGLLISECPGLPPRLRAPAQNPGVGGSGWCCSKSEREVPFPWALILWCFSPKGLFSPSGC